MSKGVKKKQRMEAELEELSLKKRSGLIRVIIAVAVFVVVTAVKEAAVAQGVELASDMFVNAAFYIMALVLAGVAGYGARDYVRANNQMRDIKVKLGR